MNEQYPNAPYETPPETPGKGAAVASMVCGIVGLVLCIAYIGFVVSIVGLALSASAKKQGFVGSFQTAGFVTSLIGLILGILYLGLLVLSILFSFAMFTL